MTFITSKNLSRHYGTGDTAVSAIAGINLSIELGEFVAVMGESGAGKSTLLSIMGAMNEPTTGYYLVDDIDVYGLSQDKRADFRREFLGFVFQSFHLMPYLTVIENVLLPLTAQKISRKEKRELAMEALENVGLADKAHRLPSQISGGEKERVAIARAIVNRPPVILADEPTGNLDTHTSREIMELLQKLNRSGTTIVMVTHSHTCSRYANRLLTVSDGKITEEIINAN
ncbi:MAG: ABC transporter ATP-binding protein [Desulfobacterales bacterium]|nr:ABC transporter ATP-binding protein [Desulfobacterales bacterium]